MLFGIKSLFCCDKYFRFVHTLEGDFGIFYSLANCSIQLTAWEVVVPHCIHDGWAGEVAGRVGVAE